MQKWLEVFKFPSVERSTYDRYECTTKHQIYPVLGDKIVSDISAADIKNLLNQKMNEGYGSIKSLKPRQVADLLGHSISQITEIYYVKKDTARLNGITDGFEM